MQGGIILNYIEKDTLLEDVKILANNQTGDAKQCLLALYDNIARKENIDVEPIKHGYWKEETEYYDDDYGECNTRKVWECSLCGRTEKTPQPYCNCGAKMDRTP